jgi:ornithine cyclodeaminase/alanine dehydrogenase-like protein (mu-crystallin family)
MRILSERAVQELIDMDCAVSSAEEAFRRSSAGQADVPLRSEIHRSDPAGTILIMPGLIGREVLGVKLVGSVASEAAPWGKATTCMMLLWDPDTLMVRGLIASELLNEHRTAAGFAAATQALSRSDSKVHVVFGAGKLALATVRYIAHIRPISRVFLISRSTGRMDLLRERIQAEPDLRHLEIFTGVAAEEAVRQADIITTITTSNTPVFDGRFVRPGTHINLGGANRADQREMEDNVAARARFWFDSHDGCRRRAGDVIIPLASGVIQESQIVGEIGDVLLGRVPGRQVDEDITVFKSLGLASQDLVLGAKLLDLADAAEAGTCMDLVNG